MESSKSITQTEALDQLSKFTRENGSMLTLGEAMLANELPERMSTFAGASYDSDIRGISLDTSGLPQSARHLFAVCQLRSLLVEPQAAEYVPKRFNLQPQEVGAMVLTGQIQYFNRATDDEIEEGEYVGYRRVIYCFRQGVAQLLDAHFDYHDRIPASSLFRSRSSILQAAITRKFTLPEETNQDIENALVHRTIEGHPQLGFFSTQLDISRQTIPDAVNLLIKS